MTKKTKPAASPTRWIGTMCGCESPAAVRASRRNRSRDVGGAREVRREHLDGDVAVELHVAREIDDPHPAAAELALERVLAGERRLELEEIGVGLRHDFIMQSSLECVNRDGAPPSSTFAGGRSVREVPATRVAAAGSTGSSPERVRRIARARAPTPPRWDRVRARCARTRASLRAPRRRAVG